MSYAPAQRKQITLAGDEPFVSAKNLGNQGVVNIGEAFRVGLHGTNCTRPADDEPAECGGGEIVGRGQMSEKGSKSRR